MTSAPVNGRFVRNCSVERTLAILDDAWSFLVLREFYMGARRFEQIRTVLQAPRSTLSERLSRLLEAGLIRQVPQNGTDGRLEYRLTESGMDLYLVMLTLMRFGDDHLCDDRGAPLTLVHAGCGHPCKPETLCSECGEPVGAQQVAYRDGPGAGRSPLRVQRQRRRSKGESPFERNRPSSVSRTLEILADRWSFLILREFFFGVRRYEQLREKLGIASNILADRLAHLVERGILRKVPYSRQPLRYEYRLSAMGRDLFLPLIQMLRWGDRWLGHESPLILTHMGCGQDFRPVVACSHCKHRLDPREVSYRLNYSLGSGASKPPAQLDRSPPRQ
ncbi:MAG TPA: helix-turn-helix domain-containing protein [Novosphingobium sp.]|nr:helix-turn-helix domain-containing protein [Novosphingobium sp.]